MKRRKREVGQPKTVMPVAPFNIPLEDALGYYSGGDDYYLTSAYCDHDQVQWIYYRQVSRGESHSDPMSCEVCDSSLYVSEIKRNYLSSTITPEVVGWISLEQNKTLDLVITESSFAEVRDVLLSHIRRLNFSGSIKRINLYQTRYHSQLGPQSRSRKDLSKDILIEQLKHSDPRPRERKLSQSEKEVLNDKSKNPLQSNPELIKRFRKQTANFLRRERSAKRSSLKMKSIAEESKASAISPKTSKLLKGPEALTLFSQWKQRLKG